MEQNRAEQLLEKYANNRLSDEERAELESWYLHLAKKNSPLSDAGVFASAMSNLDGRLFKDKNIPADTHVVPVRKLWRRLSAAAAILIFITAGLYTYRSFENDAVTEEQLVENKIRPGANIATLKLADGREIILDSTKNGEITNQAGISVRKLADGQLVYEISKEVEEASSGFNTISTPVGGQYKIVLPDGTQVWLNSSSSLTYPVQFDAKGRNVELEGEAYFEVAKHELDGKRLPFTVETRKGKQNSSGQKVEVLGTHFNIKAYADESAVITTLLEGAVKVADNGSTSVKLLKPGQHSVLSASGLSVASANTEEAVAWKDGLFMFDESRLDDVLKLVGRWYGVSIEYEDAKLRNLVFSGSVSKFTSMAKVLQVLESTGKIKFALEGRKLIVRE